MKYLLLGACFFFSVNLKAQTTYNVSQVPYNPDPFTAGTSLTLADDQASGVIPMPFGFCFFDSSYSNLLITSNGYITFDTVNNSGYSIWNISGPIPNPAEPINSIMCPWQDINPAAGGTITYSIHGVAPFRRFVVSYFQIPMFACTGMLFSEQVILYETTNIIETYILDKPSCLSWNNGLAVHGLQNQDGTVAFTVPGRNATAFACQFDGWRFSPVGGCAGNGPSCTIAGKIYNDYNADCIFNNNDAPNVNRSVLANGGNYYAWTDTAGNYNLQVDSGTWIVTEQTPTYYQTACPANGNHTVNFSSTGMSSLNNDFADSVLVWCPDLRIDIGTANMTRCFTEQVGVLYCNQGTVTDTNVNIILTLNDSLHIINSGMNYTPLANNQYQFSVGNLLPGQCGNFTFQMQIGCDTVGTVYCMNASISGNSTIDCDTTNNQSIDCHSLIASIDPNEKRVAAQNFSQLGYVINDVIDNNDELTYEIGFQNTGSDTAVNIIVRDTISSFLDPTTITVGASTASYTYAVINGVLIFNFNHIMLVDSNTNEPMSHSFVKFSIRQNQGNVAGTVIHNQAAIYFDYNSPVFTNWTSNTIPLETGVDNIDLTNNISIFPNPAEESVTLLMNEVKSKTNFQLVNMLGQIVLEKEITDNKTIINISSINAGIYFVEVMVNGMIESKGKLMIR